ncbi:phytanoyl-CoA dioxygenase family protein [Aspergillus heteromorphus CBS 117.55]|uniref:Phytanoyl-CoA dioxygenase family protein n=1 Tax=Aspergillus heteromorphus CBS 117.55 TaxID=1448321 RepID=A0A317WX48_9EURO|nr:phytanoyl-CoA dioxygenase family protein [Aspergillus heteromorphus CBS 117.55]PWY90923.1 phytanoyl-CoA dioxygenase family protein [Aspergillus heteromorphus CBS 117.55]
MPGLTPTQLATFRANGYLVLPNYLTPEEITACLTETDQLLTTFDLSTHPLTQFTTGDDPRASTSHVGDSYFLTSGDKIRYFFEPDAFTTPSPTPPTRTPPRPSANPNTSPLNAKNAAIADSLGFKDPRVLQSMVICKQPGIGGAVPNHQDSEFLYTDPPSAVGWWFALQDAGPGNATLGMYKGSHLGERVRRRFVRKSQGSGSGTEFVRNEGAKMPRGLEQEEGTDTTTAGVVDGQDELGAALGNEDDLEVLDIKAGSLVLIHGNVLHKSEKNTGPRSRFAYTFHVIEGAEGWVYDERNWLQPPESGEGFSRLFDCLE